MEIKIQKTFEIPESLGGKCVVRLLQLILRCRSTEETVGCKNFSWLYIQVFESKSMTDWVNFAKKY